MGGLRSFRSWRREDDWSGQWGTPMVACGAVPLRDRGVSANQVPCASMPMLSSLCPPLSLSLSLSLSGSLSFYKHIQLSRFENFGMSDPNSFPTPNAPLPINHGLMGWVSSSTY